MSQSEQLTLTTPMLSITNFNLPSLHLLHDEIMVTLKDTEHHLSEFNDDKEQAPLLLDSIDVLTQLSCIFNLISLKEAKLLSTAITQGLQELYDHIDQANTALIMDLSEAIIILDRYVEFVLLTKTIEPVLLLPIINKLHSHCDQPMIADDYFSEFNCSSVVIANPEKNFESLSRLNLDSDLLTRAYRSGLMVALTTQDDVISIDAKQKLAAMSAACALIAAHSQTLFWQAASAIVTDIERILPLNLSQKHALIYLEQQFKGYLPIIDGRFADLVSFACQRDHQQAQLLRQQYALNQLEDLQREQLRHFLLGPNRAVTDTLNDLIQAHINGIKEKADMYARNDSLHPIAIQDSDITSDLIELSSILHLLSLHTAAEAVQTAAVAVKKWQTPTPEDFDHLLLALISAENAAISMAKMRTPSAAKVALNNHHISLHQLDTAYNTLIEEGRTTIANVEQALNDYIGDDDHDLLNVQNVPEMIRQIAGAVRFLQLPISARMLSQLANYLDNHLANEQPIDTKALICIADIIISVDYCLEGLEYNRPVSKQSLDVAQQSLSRLLAA